MIPVILDTTVLRNDPSRKKAGFRALERLAQDGRFEIHLPYFVEQEFISQQLEIYKSGMAGITSRVARYKKKKLSQTVKDSLDQMEQELNRIDQELDDFVKQDFEEWVAQVNAVKHPIRETHGPKVAAAYFAGDHPFREKKRRDDIPDAFIWQTILDIVEQRGQVYVVSNDSLIKTACEGHSTIEAFSSLDEFISSDVCKPILKEVQAKANFARLLLLAPDLTSNIESAAKIGAVDVLAGETVTGSSIPDDNNEGWVSLVGDPEDIELRTGEAEYYGNGLVVVPVEFSVECLIDYAIFKADYYTLGEERAKQISISELNDHYFDAQEYYDLYVTTNITLDLDGDVLESEQSSDEEIIELAEAVEITLDSIETIEVVDQFDY